jgi:HEAT repeat protein
MDVRNIVISEFKSVFSNFGITLPERFLKIAESPFNLTSVQLYIDNEVEKVRKQNANLPLSLQSDAIRQLEKKHEERLRKISKQYALRLLRLVRENRYIALDSVISESTASIEQRNLKADPTVSCDIYPCER